MEISWYYLLIFSGIIAGIWKGSVTYWNKLNVVQQERLSKGIGTLLNFGLLMLFAYGILYVIILYITYP